MSSLNLRDSSLRPTRFGEEMDPMASLANLADVMLVFACGLMLSLITYWQIDVSAISEILPDNKVSEIENPEDISNQLQNMDGTAYLDMGRVYMDPVTGKYYMIVDNDSEQAKALEESVAQGSAEAASPSAADDAEQGDSEAQTRTEGAGTGAATAAQRNAESAAEGSVHAEGD